jgi:hypothetical protein
MGHRDFLFIMLLVTSLNLCAFVVLSLIRRTRTQGIIGLVGSALLLSGVIRGEFFNNLSNMVLLGIIGGALLFASTLIAMKRRYS